METAPRLDQGGNCHQATVGKKYAAPGAKYTLGVSYAEVVRLSGSSWVPYYEELYDAAEGGRRKKCVFRYLKTSILLFGTL